MRKRSEVAGGIEEISREAEAAMDEVARRGPATNGVDFTAVEKNKRAAASRPLKEELDRAERPLVTNVNAARGSPLDAGLERIVERVFVDADLDAVYGRLEKSLRVGEKWEQAGALAKALDDAESNARLAHRLYLTAKIEHERWELENEVKFSSMRGEATRALQREKDEGKRSKQITDADVTSTCAQMFGDEWVAQETRRRRVDAAEKSLAHLSEIWMSRCNTLRVLVGRAR